MILEKSIKVPKAWFERRWTIEELEAEMPETNLPMELWDGELVMSPAPFFSHQEVTGRFFVLLSAWVEKRRLGKVVAAPVDMVLTSRRTFQPDILFILANRLNIIRGKVHGPADLVAEVLSPETRRRDRIEKKDLYEQHGIQEYWILDPEAETVEVFCLKRGQYSLHGRWLPGQKAKSVLLHGFELHVADLYRDLSD